MEQNLVYPYKAPFVSGVLKSRVTDFQVIEELGFEPVGEGEHLFLWVEKTGLSTPELIARIARDYSLNPQLIGYSGLKDKHARTTQTFSIKAPGRDADEIAALLDRELDLTIESVSRHTNKLRTGHLLGNRFEITVRDVAAGW